jgi:hypothetical protein
METMQEIAQVLRSTPKMAESFVQRVREKVDGDVPDETILKAMKRLNPRSLDLTKVVVTVRAELAKGKRRTGRARSATVANPGRPERVRTGPPPVQRRRAAAAARASRAKTLMDQLTEILEGNWQRAEQEGFDPPRMNALAFVDAVHRYSDPRDATRRRILNACKAAEQQDLLITPTLVADMIREQT